MEPALAEALRKTEEVVLVTRGRRSGRSHEVTVWSALENGVLWLRTDHESDWYRNLRREPNCRVRVGNIEVAARSEPIVDEAAALRHCVELFRAKYGVE